MDIWDKVFDINGDGVTDLFEDTLAVELMEDEIEEEEAESELWAMDNIETDEESDEESADLDSFDAYDNPYEEIYEDTYDYEDDDDFIDSPYSPQLDEEGKAFMEKLRAQRVGYALEYLKNEETLREDMLPDTDIEKARAIAEATAKAGPGDYIIFIDINGNIFFDDFIEYLGILPLDQLDKGKPNNLYNEFVLKAINNSVMYYHMIHILVDTASRFSPYLHLLSENGFLSLMQPMLSLGTIYGDKPYQRFFRQVVMMEAQDTFFRSLRSQFDVRTKILAAGALEGDYLEVIDILESQKYESGQTLENCYRICDAVRSEVMSKDRDTASRLPGYREKKVVAVEAVNRRSRIYGVSLELFDSKVFYCRFDGNERLDMGDCVILWVSKINCMEKTKGYVVSIGDYLLGTEPAAPYELGVIIEKE